MLQQGQVFRLTTVGGQATSLWAYRYRIGGRERKWVQRGGFATEQGAGAALEQALENLRRRVRIGRMPTLAEFVDEYLAQHEASTVTLGKLRFLLDRAVVAFGDYRLDELSPVEIAGWRMPIRLGYRSRRRRHSDRCSPVPWCGGCSTSTRPSVVEVPTLPAERSWREPSSVLREPQQ